MIWFKNIHYYPFSSSFNTSWKVLEKLLEEKPFSPCSSQQITTMGWVPTIPDTNNLVHVSGNSGLICCQRQERLLPASVIKEHLDERVEQIKLSEDRRVGSKEKQSLKDEVVFELLPKAFLRTTKHYFFINKDEDVLVANVSSEARADELTAFLRDTLGSLQIGLMSSGHNPTSVITGWLRDLEQTPDELVFLPDIELSKKDNPDTKIKLKNLDLESREFEMHLKQEGKVQQIAFEWNERIEAVINDKCQIKRIRYADVVTEQALNDSDDDKASQWDASFTLMSDDLMRLYNDLCRWFSIRN